MIRDTFKTIAAALGIILALFLTGALVGVFITGVCFVAPVGFCL